MRSEGFRRAEEEARAPFGVKVECDDSINFEPVSGTVDPFNLISN